MANVRRTDFRRFALGMLAASVTGAGLVSVPFLIGGPIAILAFIIAIFPWTVGVWTVGAPLWLILTRFGVSSRWAAMILGAILSGAAMGIVGGHDFGLMLPIALGLAGGLAAYVGWGVAYRPDVPLPAADMAEAFA